MKRSHTRVAVVNSLKDAGLYVVFRVSLDSDAALFESQLPSIQSLVKGCKSAKDVPEGCGSLVVSPNVIVHVLVRVSTALRLVFDEKSNHLSQ